MSVHQRSEVVDTQERRFSARTRYSRIEMRYRDVIESRAGLQTRLIRDN